MTYEDGRYFCFCFYSASDLFKDIEARISMDNSLTQLIQKTGITGLKQRAINYVGEFKYETLRKVNLRPNPILTFFDKAGQSQSLNTFIYSNDFTDANAPNLFENIFCSNTEKFNGRTIPEKPKMFFMFAIALEYVSKGIPLMQEAESIFNGNDGIKGGLWTDTKFKLYDGTPISWAYQNFPGSSTSTSLEEWNPDFDHELRKTKANIS